VKGGTASAARHTTTFTANQGEAVHRWFRYSAGFSAAWAEEEIRNHRRRLGVTDPAGPVAPGGQPGQPPLILDPFVGSGTTLLAAQAQGVAAVGLEAHPFVLRVAAAKLAWSSPVDAFRATARAVLERARRPVAIDIAACPLLIRRIYGEESLGQLLRLRQAFCELADPETPAGRLVWLALAAILRPCALGGTAPWQYVLPRKRKARVAEPWAEYERQVERMCADMELLGETVPRPLAPARLLAGDARQCAGIADGSVSLVLTSPPYPNNYDYADATRLEMSFFDEVSSWGGLHEAARKYLLRSCSQHTAKERLALEPLMAHERLGPIAEELAPVCRALAGRRQERAGKKTYDTMIAAYFLDMAEVWQALGRVVRRGGQACLVVGDSAPYGVHVPVERWLGHLAEAAGFEVVGFDETRQRNVKWRNRKHRVPLREGRLWLRRR
jgi:DNA modification methylase